MWFGKNSLLPVLAAGYLIASFVAPAAATTVQQWVSISHNATFENTVGGDLVLPGGSLDPTDLLAGVGKKAKVLFTVQVAVVSLSLPISGTPVIPITNSVEVVATVPGRKRPKRVARMEAQLNDGTATMNASVTAKKILGKGIVTFGILATGAAVEEYEADVTYTMERPAGSTSR